MKTLEFIYEETAIHFLVNPTDANVMVNATEMAKLFSKEPKDFLRLEGTKNFINYQLKKTISWQMCHDILKKTFITLTIKQAHS